MYSFNKKLSSTAPLIMGILNVTEDFFYDGGKHLTEKDGPVFRAQDVFFAKKKGIL